MHSILTQCVSRGSRSLSQKEVVEQLVRCARRAVDGCVLTSIDRLGVCCAQCTAWSRGCLK